MEDSISCSPGKHSRPLRLRKRMKRKKHTIRTNNNCRDNPHESAPFLDAMYENSTNSLGGCADFNPFENALILAAADVAAPQIQRKNLSPRGFVKLEELAAGQIEQEQTREDVPGPETQFGITESEFVRFCDEIQVDVEPEPVAIIETPKAPKKSIVDVILEDFCGSPYDESPPRTACADATPIFRFKSKSLRTYSRRAKTKPLRRNIECELANAHLSNDDSNGSLSSGLSVQEDLSQNVVPQLDTVDLNNSVKVCENLFNLSMYFSQEKHSPQEKRSESLTCIVEDIMRLKQKTFVICRAESPEEFCGFTDSEGGSKEDTLKDLLEDEDELLQQINCDSHCYDPVPKNVPVHYESSVDLVSILEDVDAVIERANRLITSISDVTIKHETDVIQTEEDCDKGGAISSQSALATDEQLAVDVDLWNDNDLLLNYMTQPPDMAANVPYKKLSQDKGATKFPSKVFHGRKEDKPEGRGTCYDASSHSNEKRASCNDECYSASISSSTASRKPIELLTKHGRGEVDRLEENQQESAVYLGFSTASRKPITISENAKRRADKLIAELELETVGEEELLLENERVVKILPQSSSSRKSIAIPEGSRGKKEQTIERSNALIANNCGFSTASRKPIAISAEAQRRADVLLKQFDQSDQEFFLEPKETDKIPQVVDQEVEDMLMGIEFLTEAFDEEITFHKESHMPARYQETNAPSSPIFEGFKTASKKSIEISDAAKERAEKILKSIEATDVPPEFLKCIEPDLEQVPAAKENLETMEKDSPSLKRKRNLLLFDNVQNTPKVMSPRRLSCDERTPLNQIGNTALRKTPSLPLIKTISKTSFLSRRNLLSLSKRKKHNSPEKTINHCPAPKTPENQNNPLPHHNKAIATPNLNAFFDSVSTSTPRLIRKANDSSIDPDIRKIDWEDTKSSVHVASTRSITDLNVTGMEVSPTPKQRMERLKMYGEPPAISPILMINKCRPSGLRRGRSLMKS